MWILPKQLHTSDFVPDTEGLNWDSTELSEICARSLFVRSKASPARTWSAKWRRDSWTQHLFGRILKPSHGEHFVTAWTSSLAVIPASHSAQPENASAPMTLGTSGPSSQTEFDFFAPASASLKMSKATSASDSERSLESWNKLVIQRRGEYSARLKSGRLTSGSACLSWPTIRASEYKDTGPIGSKSHDHMLGKGYLCAVVTQDAANWPTPCAMEAEKAGLFDKGQMGQSLSAMANRGELSNWPTPDASNHRDGEVLRKDNNLEQGGFHGVSLHHAMTKYGQAAPANWSTPNTMDTLPPKSPEGIQRVLTHDGRKNRKSTGNLREDVVQFGLPAPANPSTDGSRQELSEQSLPNWQTFAHGTHNRGETPHRQVVKALVNGDKAKTQCLTVDQVFAEEIKGTSRQGLWPTPDTQTGPHGARGVSTNPNHQSAKSLEATARTWATPRVGGEEKAETRLARGKDIGLHGQVGAMKNTAKLNPRWVETLMGLPVGWTMPSCKSPVTIALTSCDSSATESCQPQPSELFAF